MSKPTAREVRAWGQRNTGGALPSRGSLPAALVLAYNRAHPEAPFGDQFTVQGTGYWNGHATTEQRQRGGTIRWHPIAP